MGRSRKSWPNICRTTRAPRSRRAVSVRSWFCPLVVVVIVVVLSECLLGQDLVEQVVREIGGRADRGAAKRRQPQREPTEQPRPQVQGDLLGPLRPDTALG